MLRRDSPTPREHMSERLWMRDRMALLHSVCHHHEFVKTSHRGSHESCSPQVLTEPRLSELLKGLVKDWWASDTSLKDNAMEASDAIDSFVRNHAGVSDQVRRIV